MSDKIALRQARNIRELIGMMSAAVKAPTELGDVILEIHLPKDVTKEQINVEGLMYLLQTPGIGLGDSFQISFRQRG